MRTGFIGLGAMGQPLAGHLQARGLLDVVGNRTVGKAERVATDLLVRAATRADDYSDCDAVVLCVSADAEALADAPTAPSSASTELRPWPFAPGADASGLPRRFWEASSAMSSAMHSTAGRARSSCCRKTRNPNLVL